MYIFIFIELQMMNSVYSVGLRCCMLAIVFDFLCFSEVLEMRVSTNDQATVFKFGKSISLDFCCLWPVFVSMHRKQQSIMRVGVGGGWGGVGWRFTLSLVSCLSHSLVLSKLCAYCASR